MELGADSEGNKILSFEDDSSDYNIMQIGNNLKDFEILQILSGDKDKNFVAKVRSLKNNKTYSLKKIILSQLYSINNIQYIESLLNQLTILQNPHIIKYYGYFKDYNMNENTFYLVMEYMDNSDLLGYIQAHQVFNKPIKEEEIWNILLVCLSALDYLSNNNLGKMGIKLTNVFMNNKQNIKIAVFRDIFFSSSNYNHIEEIKFLGKYCYIMMNSQNIKCEDLDKNDYITKLNNINVQNSNYSQILKEIVNSMIGSNNITANNLFIKVKNEYNKKYNKNTSIKAILKCLYSYNKLNQKILKKRSIFESNINKYYMNYLYLKSIEALKNRENNINQIINEYRRIIVSYFFKLDESKEIDPLLFLTFLLDKIHKETNRINEEKIKLYGNNNKNYIRCSANDGEEEDKTNKMQMLNEFVTYFNASMNSFISDLFFGFVKTKRICQTCKAGYYSFSNYLYIAFDLSERDSKKDFDLMKDGFDKEYNSKEFFSEEKPNKIYCDRCITYQKFVEFNRYFMFNNQLIICFIRGNNCKNKSKIIFSEMIDLHEHEEQDINLPKNFYLVGNVNRIFKNNVEAYTSYIRDPLNRTNFSINNINQNNIDEQIIMLFYNSDDITT